jgi:hypothetical protein
MPDPDEMNDQKTTTSENCPRRKIERDQIVAKALIAVISDLCRTD